MTNLPANKNQWDSELPTKAWKRKEFRKTVLLSSLILSSIVAANSIYSYKTSKYTFWERFPRSIDVIVYLITVTILMVLLSNFELNPFDAILLSIFIGFIGGTVKNALKAYLTDLA